MTTDQFIEAKTIQTNQYQVETITKGEGHFFWTVKEVKRDPNSELETSVIMTLIRDKRIPRYKEVVLLENLIDRKIGLEEMIRHQRKWPFLIMAFIGIWLFVIGFAAMISPGEWDGSSAERWVMLLLGIVLPIIGIWRWTVINKRTKEFKAEFEANPTLDELYKEYSKLRDEILEEMRQ